MPSGHNRIPEDKWTDVPLYDVVPEWSPERKEAFAMYRDMGAERSVRGAAQRLGKDASLIARWSSEDGWVMRCAAWDAYCDQQQQRAMIEERERVARMHASAIDSTIEVLMQAPLALAQKIRNGELKVDPDENDAYTLTRATEAAAKVLPSLVNASRLVHGFSTANVDVKTTGVEGKTPEELDFILSGFDDGSSDILELTEGDDPGA